MFPTTNLITVFDDGCSIQVYNGWNVLLVDNSESRYKRLSLLVNRLTIEGFQVEYVQSLESI